MLFKVLAVLVVHLWGSGIVFTPEEFAMKKVETKLIAIFGRKCRTEIENLSKGTMRADATVSPVVSISPPSSMQTPLTPGSDGLFDIEPMDTDGPLISFETGLNAGIVIGETNLVEQIAQGVDRHVEQEVSGGTSHVSGIRAEKDTVILHNMSRDEEKSDLLPQR
ncbi:Hypothetical protein PHPALM_372 [Phytophthora palmivora]|uniref:Uncharacterized protein n=1 Tax=Phytophthora palmivora TaxID=4796 RepID=A0A2P4YV11_9STRA|nr:Hypothetical protein PHPALM_372 [Phytophthora palmivora]